MPLRLCAALMSLILLSSCLLTPGKFDSTLDIRKDGGFTFTYGGEVKVGQDNVPSLPVDIPNSRPGDDPKDGGVDKAGVYLPVTAGKNDAQDMDKASKLRAIADALSREKGFRSARYAGGDTIEIDYAISGRLDHSFVFPFNIDAEAVIPFVAVEVRKDGRVRLQAPGFGSPAAHDGSGLGIGDGDRTEGREGTFTLTTDAEIVSHNQEDGASATSRGRQIVWKVTPLTKTAPMAVLKLPGA